MELQQLRYFVSAVEVGSFTRAARACYVAQPSLSQQIRKLEEEGCLLIRHGGRHDWYQNPKTGVSQPVPRHREIKEFLAKYILKKLKAGPG